MDTVYLDNNATTKPAPEVVEAVSRSLAEDWGNPSSIHRIGQQARAKMELAREQVCRLIGCQPRELIFTSGATESNNTAYRGILATRPGKRTFITTKLEHSAGREPAERLAEIDGYNVVYLPVDIHGLVDPADLNQALTDAGDDAAMVSIHYINNETGAVQPLVDLGEVCRLHRVPFFTDGTQAVGKVAIDVSELPIDAMSFSGHKFHGPKGVGGLYIRSRVGLIPQVIGGPHERDRRAGTENVPGIVGIGVAAELCRLAIESNVEQTGADLRDRLERELLAKVPDAAVNSAGAPRIWNTLNIGFPPLESEAILLLLSERGVYAAAGAACSTGSLEPSPILQAQGIDPLVAHGSIRLSLSRYSTAAEIDRAIEIIPPAIAKLRESMPIAR